VSTETRSNNRFVVEFEFNRAVNPETLRNSEGWTVKIERVGGRTLTIEPESVSASDDGMVITVLLLNPLSSSNSWRITLHHTVTDTAGNTFNGLPVEFTVPSEFIMISRPKAQGTNRSLYEFTLSHRPVNPNGAPLNRMVENLHYRCRIHDNGVFRRTWAPPGRPPRPMLNQAPYLSGGRWLLQLTAEAVQGANDPDTTRVIYFEIKDLILGEDGHLFSGGDGGSRSNGWWSWELKTIGDAPRLPELTITWVRFTAGNVITIRFDDDLHVSAVIRSYRILQGPPGVTIVNRSLDPTVGSDIHLRLSRNLSGGESIRLEIPAGIRSIDNTRSSRLSAHNVEWTAPRPTYEVVNGTFALVTGIVTFELSKRISTASHRSHIIARGLTVLRTSVLINPLRSGGPVRVYLQVHLRTPIRPGAYRVTLNNSLHAVDGSALTGDS